LLYPIEAFAGAFLTVAAAASHYFDRIARPAFAIPLCAAIVFSWCGLLLTIKAAPIMLGINEVNDPAALQAAFDGFRFWGNIRGASQVLAFAALMWALRLLLRKA
jgi:hypothetical protein